LTRYRRQAITTTTAPAGVIGCGLIGSGIAEALARAGRRVLVYEVGAVAAGAGRRRVARSLDRADRSGRLTEQNSAAPARIVVGCGVHFFNPLPVLPLVEIVPSLLTSNTTVQRVEQPVQVDLDKTVTRSQDRAGFIVNSLLGRPYLLTSMRMLESGFAGAQDIDAGMVRGCAHPMGPLALSDLIGVDTVKALAKSMYVKFKEPLYSPPHIPMRMVDAGLLGRKTGRGSQDYARSAS
jgi:3-hydroxyacyl-CoA dehydrogenase